MPVAGNGRGASRDVLIRNGRNSFGNSAMVTWVLIRRKADARPFVYVWFSETAKSLRECKDVSRHHVGKIRLSPRVIEDPDKLLSPLRNKTKKWKQNPAYSVPKTYQKRGREGPLFCFIVCKLRCNALILFIQRRKSNIQRKMYIKNSTLINDIFK